MSVSHLKRTAKIHFSFVLQTIILLWYCLWRLYIEGRQTPWKPLSAPSQTRFVRSIRIYFDHSTDELIQCYFVPWYIDVFMID